MIEAGVYFVEGKSNLKIDEILTMPYPAFKRRVDYYADPEKFLKPPITQKDYDEQVREYYRKRERTIQRLEAKKKE